MSRAICAVLVCGLAAAGSARAEPRTDPTAGRAVFSGAATPSATSIEVNPAALALGKDEIYLATTLVADTVSIDQKTLDIASGALSPGASIHDTQLGPGGMLALVLHYKDAATFAAALHTTPVEMFPTGHDELEYHVLAGGERIYSGILSSSFKLTDELYLGVSIATARRMLHLRYARDTALENGHGANGIDSDCGSGMPCGVGNPNATEIYDVTAQARWSSLDALTVNLGLLYVLSKDSYLAVAYHTVPGVDLIQYSLTGSMMVTRAPRDGGGTVNGEAVVNMQDAASVDAELRTRVVPSYELHVGFRWEDLSRFQAYDVRGFGSTFPSNRIPEWTERPRGYHDPYALWAGLESVDAGGIGLDKLDAWRFGARLGVESRSVDDSRTSPITIAPWSLTADLGASVRIADNLFTQNASLTLQATYGVQYYLPVSVSNSTFDPRDRIDCIDSGYDYSTTACENTRLGYAIATAAGDYHRITQALAIALRYNLP